MILSTPHVSYSGPLCLLVSESVRDWLVSIGAPDANPYDELRLESDRLIPIYKEQLGIQTSGDPIAGIALYQARIAGALAYHWWRFRGDHGQYQPLSEVCRRVQAGHLSYRRFNEDILREIVLTEGCCQNDPTASKLFLEEYSWIIAEAARKAGGGLAEQELEDFGELLMQASENGRAKLSNFSGETPLRLWLRPVVRNKWLDVTRGKKAKLDDEIIKRLTLERPDDPAIENQECLEILKPLFAQAAAVLSREESVILRMVFLDGVRQNQVAQLFGVDPATISRWKESACSTLLSALNRVASSSDGPKGAKDCLDWLKHAPSEHRRVLGGILTAKLRRRR